MRHRRIHCQLTHPKLTIGMHNSKHACMLMGTFWKHAVILWMNGHRHMIEIVSSSGYSLKIKDFTDFKTEWPLCTLVQLNIQLSQGNVATIRGEVADYIQETHMLSQALNCVMPHSCNKLEEGVNHKEIIFYLAVQLCVHWGSKPASILLFGAVRTAQAGT